MDLFSSIQTQHHIATFPVGPFDYLIVHQNTIGSQRKTEILAFFLFNTPCIGDQVLHHLEVHQRLTTKEVHLQIPSGTGIGD